MELNVILVLPAGCAAMRLVMIMERNAEEHSGRMAHHAGLEHPVTFARTKRPSGVHAILLPVGHAGRMELCVLLLPPVICAVTRLLMECSAEEERRPVTVTVEETSLN